MPQVKLKQGTKSSINNNAGVLNAGTLAVTTDTNELFITHNDGTVHQLCNPEINGIAERIAILESKIAFLFSVVAKPLVSSDNYRFITSDNKILKVL